MMTLNFPDEAEGISFEDISGYERCDAWENFADEAY